MAGGSIPLDEELIGITRENVPHPFMGNRTVMLPQ